MAASAPVIKALNLTPHGVVIWKEERVVVELRSMGNVRATTSDECVVLEQTSLDVGLPVVIEPCFTGVEGLPADKTLNIIVSSIAANAMNTLHVPWTGHVLVPDTGPGSVVRDANRQIIGVRRLFLMK